MEALVLTDTNPGPGPISREGVRFLSGSPCRRNDDTPAATEFRKAVLTRLVDMGIYRRRRSLRWGTEGRWEGTQQSLVGSDWTRQIIAVDGIRCKKHTNWNSVKPG